MIVEYYGSFYLTSSSDKLFKNDILYKSYLNKELDKTIDYVEYKSNINTKLFCIPIVKELTSYCLGYIQLI